MSYHPRIETKKYSSFITTRCKNSELWFVNNKKLETRILAYLAKYTTVYQVLLYAFAIEGNHIQMVADFPLENRSDFMRDFNSMTAKLVAIYCSNYPGGKLWERRYSAELIPHHTDDIEDKFFYIALQVVQDGLVQKLSDYPGYIFFHDAANDIKRDYKVVDWTSYNRARRSNPAVPIKKYETTYTLKYQRIPGYDHLTQKQYCQMLYKKLEEKRIQTINKRLSQGKGFAGPENLKQTIPGAKPRTTKKSDRTTHRPRVLSTCHIRRAHALDFYFDNYYKYKDASLKLRKGFHDVCFPPGMYKPYVRPPPPLQAA